MTVTLCIPLGVSVSVNHPGCRPKSVGRSPPIGRLPSGENRSELGESASPCIRDTKDQHLQADPKPAELRFRNTCEDKSI